MRLKRVAPPPFFDSKSFWESIPGTTIAVVSVASLAKCRSAEPQLIAA
jgi:hypothetical protein